MKTEAFISFIKKQEKKPYYESSAITGLQPKLFFKIEKVKVQINNLRDNITNLEKDGFELQEFKSNYNIDNINKNLKNYQFELEKHVNKIYDVKKISIFDFTIRSNSKTGAYNKDGFRQPADRAHVDYTLFSGPKRAKDVLGEEIVNKSLNNNQRIIQLNIWKPLSKKVLSSPLAIASPKYIKKSDLIATDQIFPNRVGEIYHLSYDPNQKWFWVPEMHDNEILIIKNWDSKRNKKQFVPHTSFNLSRQNKTKNPRVSIEARMFIII